MGLPKKPNFKCKRDTKFVDQERCAVHNIVSMHVVAILETLKGFFEQMHYHIPSVPIDGSLPKENKQQMVKQYLSPKAKEVLQSTPGVKIEQFLYDFATKVATARTRAAEEVRLLQAGSGTTPSSSVSSSKSCTIDVNAKEYRLLSQSPMECCSVGASLSPAQKK